MLGHEEFTMQDLFAQLGLDNSDDAITAFIKSHQLPKEVMLVDAPFWNDAQRAFLKEEQKLDAAWTLLIDELNVELHQDAM